MDGVCIMWWYRGLGIYSSTVCRLFIYSRSSHMMIAEYGSAAGKVAYPAHGQLNRENNIFPVPVRACEFGFARRIRLSRPASAC